jgi:hypothetical protein
MSMTGKATANIYLFLFLLVTSPLLSAFASSSATTHTVSITPNGFLIELASASETVQYQWIAPDLGSLYSIGSVVITDSVGGASPQGQITLPSKIDWVGPSQSLQSVVYQTSGAPSVTLTYGNSAGTTHLTLSPVVDGQFGGIRFAADKATLQDIYLGQVPSTLPTRPISVPYYSQPVSYLSSLDLFENSYFDPFGSHATMISTSGGQETYYGPNQTGTRNILKEIWKVSVSKDIVSVLPYPEHPASPYMAAVSGRMVLDIRNQTPFATIASRLTDLANYGVKNCIAIIGSWQRFGYDDGLPSQFPASTSLGGDTDMHAISSAANTASCMFALHENYTDDYPDSPGYSAADTMRNVDGTQMLAWLNPVTHLQSFAIKPNLFIANAKTQSAAIHQTYGTNASFIDVNSSATPWWRSDEDPAAYGNGSFSTYRDASIGLWAYERSVENGPVFGEGKYHWFWSGLLDGVEAQFGAESTTITNGLAAPLFVDFDLTRIHPLQVNYGMGYYNRWSGVPITSTVALDAYRMQEVIYGHAPYLADGLWSSVPRALLEQSLVSPTAARYALQTPSAITYMVNGIWSDASNAAKAGDFSLSQVSYPNGDQIVASSRTSSVAWNSIVIPQYGWAALGTNYRAYTALVGGQIADYSQTPLAIYANARNQGDLISENTVATPGMFSFKQTARRTLQMQLSWDVNKPDPTIHYQEFVHFVSSQTPTGSNDLSGATGGALSVPSESWTTGERVVDNILTYTLPSAMTDGTYQVRVGLYSGAQRAVLYGNNDGNLRYNVGTITVSNNGATLAFTATPIFIGAPDPRLNSSGTVVDFGAVRTDGMVFLQQQVQGGANKLQLSSYPRSRDVVVQFAASVVPLPSSLSCDNGDVLVPSRVDQKYWQVDLRGRKYCSWSGTLQP